MRKARSMISKFVFYCPGCGYGAPDEIENMPVSPDALIEIVCPCCGRRWRVTMHFEELPDKRRREMTDRLTEIKARLAGKDHVPYEDDAITSIYAECKWLVAEVERLHTEMADAFPAGTLWDQIRDERAANTELMAILKARDAEIEHLRALLTVDDAMVERTAEALRDADRMEGTWEFMARAALEAALRGDDE